MLAPSFHTSIHVSGIDAQKFLQGQLTCDVSTGTPTLGAHCNPKGRVISLFWLTQKDDQFKLELPTDLLALALENLTKYARLFKNCTIAVDTNGIQPDSHKWRLDNIQRGIPVIYAATSGLFLPHDLNLAQLGSISFTKGCYTGQEIVARMHYLGTPKRHLYHVTLATINPLMPGEIVYLADQLEQAIGHIVDAVVNGNQVEATAVLTESAIAGKISLLVIIGAVRCEIINASRGSVPAQLGK